MTEYTISGQPLRVGVMFPRVDAYPPMESHQLGAPGDPILGLIDPFLTPDQQKALQRLLSTPLDQLFTTVWQGQHDHAAAQVKQKVIETVAKQTNDDDEHPYGIEVSLPETGTLTAEVTAGIGSRMWDVVAPGTTGSVLDLRYRISPCSVFFHVTTDTIFGSWADPSFRTTFDVVLDVAIAVPEDASIPCGVTVQAQTQKMDQHSANVSGWFVEAYATIRYALLRLFHRPAQDPNNIPDHSVDMPATVTDELTHMLAALSSATTYGFVQLGVRIGADGSRDYVEFDLTHPFDPGPEIYAGPIFTAPPVLSTSVPSARAGGSLVVTGTDFPLQSATGDGIIWQDTTSGVVRDSEVQWGPVDHATPPPPSPESAHLARSGSGGDWFTPTDVTLDTAYAIRVRDYDVPGFVATEWSEWVLRHTATTDKVQLVLADAADTTLGYATLNGGAFTTTLDVPADETPGSYALRALVDGRDVASTAIVVIGAGGQLVPFLRLLDASGNGSAPGATVTITAGDPRTYEGGNFQPGGMDLRMDSTSGEVLAMTTADADGHFTVTFAWPQTDVGEHHLVAVQGSLDAVLDLYAARQPH